MIKEKRHDLMYDIAYCGLSHQPIVEGEVAYLLHLDVATNDLLPIEPIEIIYDSYQLFKPVDAAQEAKIDRLVGESAKTYWALVKKNVLDYFWDARFVRNYYNISGTQVPKHKAMREKYYEKYSEVSEAQIKEERTRKDKMSEQQYIDFVLARMPKWWFVYHKLLQYLSYRKMQIAGAYKDQWGEDGDVTNHIIDLGRKDTEQRIKDYDNKL